jgi:hypothetical protein
VRERLWRLLRELFGPPPPPPRPTGYPPGPAHGGGPRHRREQGEEAAPADSLLDVPEDPGHGGQHHP